MSGELDDKFNQSMNTMSNVWKELSDKLSQFDKDNQEALSKKDVAYTELETKYKEAKAKVDHIESQLQDTVNRLESISKTKASDIDALQLLDIYLVLMEQVFESGPHVRLLLMLHGDADEYKLNDLSQASGISAIQVRQAMFELRNAGVVTYNDETQVVALTQRFLN